MRTRTIVSTLVIVVVAASFASTIDSSGPPQESPVGAAADTSTTTSSTMDQPRSATTTLDFTGLSATTSTLGLRINRRCGDPNEDERISASDALSTLRAAVGISPCELCICDVDVSGVVTASDALVLLRSAVGQDDAHICMPCP